MIARLFRKAPRYPASPQPVTGYKAMEKKLRSELFKMTAMMVVLIGLGIYAYDFVIAGIMAKAALNMLTLNGLVAADAVMIPMQCEYYALEGLSDLVETIRKVRKHLNPRLEIEGLLRTMYDPRNSLAQQVSAQLQQHFGDKLYATIIPRNVRLAEAPSFGAPAVSLDKACKGSQAYMELANELLLRSSAAPVE